LASGDVGFTLQPELNWHVLLVTLGLSVLSGVFFGLVPAIQSTRPASMPALRDARLGAGSAGMRSVLRVNANRALVAVQIAISLLLLVGAGLFVRTLSNLQSIDTGYESEKVLLFEVNARQTGRSQSEAAIFYADLRRRVSKIAGVRAATLSHASLISAGRQLPIVVDGTRAVGTRILGTGPAFFTTMQIPILRGREIDERDGPNTASVAVVSDLFATTYLGTGNPIGRRITLAGPAPPVARVPRDLEIIGVAATARYGRLKEEVPPVVYIPYAQITFPPLAQMTYAMRTDDDPLAFVSAVRAAVRDLDALVPVSNVKTQAAEIDQTINQEIVFARLCTAFALLALVIACVGLYGTLAYATARRTSEIGIRMALGAGRRTIVWMVLREVCVMAAAGLAVSVPIVLATSRFVESFLFQVEPNDPTAVAAAVGVLMTAALFASYGPARKASRISPTAALRQD
jgi:predicted permease